MHRPKPIQENETHKILWDLGIQMDHLIQDSRTGLGVVKKKKRNISNNGFCCCKITQIKIHGQEGEDVSGFCCHDKS